MNGKSKTAVFFVAGFALALAFATGGAGVQYAAAQSATAGMAEEVYKNIQVLNGIPADQVIPTMRYFETALGVGCNHCHVAERELDTNNRKRIARNMIKMTAAINKDAFGGRREVTCFTCHRGSVRPVGMPTFHGQESQPVSTLSADEILDKYIAALGGADAIQKVSSRVAKGTVTETRTSRPEPIRSAVEISAKAPGKRTTVTRLANGRDGIETYDGDVGWVRGANGRPRDMRSEELDTAKLEDPFFFAGQLKEIVSNLRVQRVEKVGGREAYVVFGRTQALPQVMLYFDRESGMLVRLIHYTDTAVGRYPTQIDYADFRTLDGVKVPFRWTIAEIRGRRYTYQMDDVQENIPIEDSRFAKPSAPVASR